VNHFFVDGTDSLILDYAYSGWLVALSFLVATCGSALALYIASSLVKSQSKQAKTLLMATGAIAFGSAVWSMHFIGMLAFSLCAVVTYDMTITLVSVLPAIAAAWVVLHWISKPNLTLGHLLRGGLLIGAGIGLMHYSGMYAMKMNAALRFEPTSFAFSIVAAVVLATLSLWSRNRLLVNEHLGKIHANILSAIIMGVAITTMHYLGMDAARFIGQPEATTPIPAADWFYLSLIISLGITSILGYVASGVLYSRLSEALTDLKIHDLELQTIVQHSTEAIVTTTADGSIKHVNRTFESLFGYEAKSTQGDHLSTFLPDWFTILYKHDRSKTIETIGKHLGGVEFPLKVSLAKITSNSTAYYLCFLADLTETKQVQERLIQDANQDFLTKLWNRRYLINQLQLEIDRTQRSAEDLGLIMLDIDHFKRINDTYGHIAGDQVLKALAIELRSHSRSGDVAARFGGEEFVVLLPNATAPQTEAVANRLREDFAKLVIHTENGQRISFTVSVLLSLSA
jgi:diguanylate cyclase (GGDEF)-like protein/PAS domain S-box-containing protein